MNPALKKVSKWAGVSLAALALIGAIAIFRLVYIAAPTTAMSMQFDGFVSLPKGSTLTVLDYLTLSDRQLFVTNESTGTVYNIELPEAGLPQTPSRLSLSPPPAAAHGVALDSSKRVAFVTRSEANRVDAFDVQTMKTLAQIPVGEDADGTVYDADHDLVYVAHGDAHLASLIDPHKFEVTGTIALGGKPEFMALDPVSHTLYQNLRDLNTVAEVDLGARRVIGQWALAGCVAPSGMALDSPMRRLLIVCAGNATLVVFDLTKHQVTTSLPVGSGPDSVALDAVLHRVYTTGKAGELSVISQDSADAYHLLDSIALHYGAHTLAVDPRTHYLYVGYAALIVAPRIAVFEPKATTLPAAH